MNAGGVIRGLLRQLLHMGDGPAYRVARRELDLLATRLERRASVNRAKQARFKERRRAKARGTGPEGRARESPGAQGYSAGPAAGNRSSGGEFTGTGPRHRRTLRKEGT